MHLKSISLDYLIVHFAGEKYLVSFFFSLRYFFFLILPSASVNIDQLFSRKSIYVFVDDLIYSHFMLFSLHFFSLKIIFFRKLFIHDFFWHTHTILWLTNYSCKKKPTSIHTFWYEMRTNNEWKRSNYIHAISYKMSNLLDCKTCIHGLDLRQVQSIFHQNEMCIITLVALINHALMRSYCNPKHRIRQFVTILTHPIYKRIYYKYNEKNKHENTF